MTPTRHTVISAVTSVGFFYFTQSLIGTATCFFAGILIDLDHILDFLIEKKRFPFNYADLWSFCAYEKAGKLYLILHSYEFFVVWWFLVVYYHLNYFWLGLMVGMTVHMLADQISNPCKPWAYFLLCRIKCGFSREIILNEEFYKTLK